jgi:hypothetical protein
VTSTTTVAPTSPAAPIEDIGAGRDAPTPKRGAFDTAPLTVPLMGASLLALLVSGGLVVGVVRGRRPRLAGTIEIISSHQEEDHAHQP